MALIDYTYFINNISLPIDDLGNELTYYINKYEPEILTKVLGYDLYSAFKTALSGTPATKWTELRDGKEYESGGITYHYRGLINSEKESLIANYVFYMYSVNGSKYNASTGIRQVDSENSKMIDNSFLQAAVYNEMCDMIDEMHQFIVEMNSTDSTTYPNFLPAAIRRINAFNI